MRDERGEMVPNAHLLGFYRRIVRLLSNRIRPVFVFDGATPALKRQTAALRQRQRGRADVKRSRLAEKLLLSAVRARLPKARLPGFRAPRAAADASRRAPPQPRLQLRALQRAASQRRMPAW